MKKSKYLIIAVTFLILLLSSIQAGLSNVLSTSGVELDTVNTELEFYKTENMLIREKLYMQESLASIAEKAPGLGLKESESKLVLTKPSIVLSSFLPLIVKR